MKSIFLPDDYLEEEGTRVVNALDWFYYRRFTRPEETRHFMYEWNFRHRGLHEPSEFAVSLCRGNKKQ